MTYLTKSLIALFIAGALTVMSASVANAQEQQTATPLPEESSTVITDLSILADGESNLVFSRNFLTGEYWPGLAIDASLNGNDSVSTGGLVFYGEDANCDTETGQCLVVGYCVESDTPMSSMGSLKFIEITDGSIDERAVYLAWQYDSDFHGSLGAEDASISSAINANTAPVYAAVQALIWGYVSDDINGTQSWGGFNFEDSVVDPATGFSLEDGIVPDQDIIQHLGGILGGFLPGSLTEPYLFENDPQGLIDYANSMIVQLHAEASAKQGPWVFAQNAEATGLTLMGSVGPIAGEPVVFDNGVTAVTDANGFVSWVEGSLSASVERPGKVYKAEGISGMESVTQDALVVQSELVTVTRSAEPVIEDPVEEDPEEETPEEETPEEETPEEEEPETEDPVTEDPEEETPEEETPETEDPVTEDPVTEDPEEETPVTEDPVDETPETEELEEIAITDETPETEEPVTEDPVDETPETEELEEIAITDETPETEEELPLTGGMHLYMAAIALSLLVAGFLLLASSKIKAAYKVIA